ELQANPGGVSGAVVEGVAVDRNGAVLVGDDHVQRPVVVQIDQGDPAGVVGRGDAGLLGHVDELQPVGVAAVELEAARLVGVNAAAAQVAPHVGVGVSVGAGLHQLVVDVPVVRAGV